MRKLILWLLLGGMTYYAIEGLWRLASNGGWAHVAMLPVGGLCLFLVGGINQIPAFYEQPIRKQALIGALIVTIVEFVSGCILNLWLGLGIWDYSQMPFNILGQVCLLYTVLWFLLMPLAIWLEDRAGLVYHAYKLYRGENSKEKIYDYTLKAAYLELLAMKVKNREE